MAKILVVDDELGIRDLLFEILNDEGHTVELAENANQARQVKIASRPDLVLLDIWMPDTDGVSLLKEWANTGQLDVPVIMMSGHATVDTAVEATRLGATSFLEKPITLQKLLSTVQQALAKIDVRRDHIPRENSGFLESVMMAGRRMPEPDPMPLSPGAKQMFSLDGNLRDARDAFERAYFEYHLSQESGSMTRVAEKTGLERTHLYRKLKQLGIEITRVKRIR